MLSYKGVSRGRLHLTVLRLVSKTGALQVLDPDQQEFQSRNEKQGSGRLFKKKKKQTPQHKPQTNKKPVENIPASTPARQFLKLQNLFGGMEINLGKC